jgi:hypothetical protein
MSNPLANLAQAPNAAVWTDPEGNVYLIEKRPDQSVTFTPLQSALARLQQPAPLARYEPPARAQGNPLRTVLLAIGAVLGFVLAGYLIGFFAGKSGQSVVVVPRSPVCSTQTSSFLFWTSEKKDCQ